jgi:AcrR family transcriptional regulator
VPLPRFAKLPPARQASILKVAAEEFSRAGYEEASYNRIIEITGLSKGAMYYYFQDKEDLYVTVVRRAMAPVVRLFDRLPKADSPDEYWLQLELIFGDEMASFYSDPVGASLSLGYVRTRTLLERESELDDLYDRARRWFEDVLTLGQRIAAVRRDVPMDLLVTMVRAVAEASDSWMAENWHGLSESPPGAMTELAAQISDMIRRLTHV